MDERADMEQRLDDALDTYKGDKWSLYTIITGKDWWGASLGLGETHPYTIYPEHMDKIFVLVKRMQLNYLDPSHGQTQYYEPPFQKIDESYFRNDLKEFTDDIASLLSSIVLD